jgi:hypothetical protein
MAEVLNLLARRKRPGKIQDIQLDLTTREVHDFRNTITNYPVEEGFVISDHVKQEAETVVLEGMITNYPTKFPGQRQIGQFQNKDEDVFNEIVQLAGFAIPDSVTGKYEQVKDPEVIDIITAYRTYTDMIIINFNVTRTRRTSGALWLTITAQKIRKVRSNVTTILNVKNTGTGSNNIENKAPERSDTGTNVTKKRTESALFNIVDNVVDLDPLLVE